MKVLVTNRKITLSILIVIVLIYSAQIASSANIVSVEPGPIYDDPDDPSLTVKFKFNYTRNESGFAARTFRFQWRQKTPPGEWMSAEKVYTVEWRIYWIPIETVTATKTYIIEGLLPGTTYEVRLDSGAIHEGTTPDVSLLPAPTPIYWTDYGTGRIQRTNGSNVEDLVTWLSSPQGIALDVSGGKMYWTDWGTDTIQRANLDGSNVEDLVTGLSYPQGIALDVSGGKMYWTDGVTDTIQRANLDGSNIEVLVAGLEGPGSIALAIPAETIPSTPDLVVEAIEAAPSTVAPGETFRLYATLKNNGTGESTATTLRYYRSTDAVISTEDTQLRSASRDPLAANATIRRYLTVTAPTTPRTYYYGACVDGVTDESDTANNCSRAVSVTVTAPPVVSEDVNEDGVVDVQDLVSVAQQYGQTGTTIADVNDDGIVNIDDLILVAAVLDADAAAAPSLYPDSLEWLSVSDVRQWLSQARQRDFTDPSVRRGILFLEQLLASMVPKETALLSNYPNPFNPETWIPYQLSKPAYVTLTIYAANGQVVRRLVLGHQPALSLIHISEPTRPY